MTKHSFLPPSGAAAWSKCAMWPTMNAKFPQDESAESQEGTAAHWVMAEMLAGRAVSENTLTPGGITVTGEMIEGAEMVRDTVREQETRDLWHVEMKVDAPQIQEQCFGTADVWTFIPDTRHLNIVDYKFGHRFVEEYWNSQGLLYMAGILNVVLGAGLYMPDTVSFTIVQPRCFHQGAPVRTHTYKLSEATPHLSRIREAAERAYAPAPVATTGPQCEHCPGRHACPTLQRAAYSDAETSTDQQPVELTPQSAALELRMLERALLRLTARVEGLREQTLANIKAGAHVTHYKLEAGRSTTKWTITPEEVIKLGKKHKKPLGVPKVLTPNQASKLFLDENIISPYTLNIPGGLRLVESNNADAARVFKSKETYEQPRKPIDSRRTSGDGQPL